MANLSAQSLTILDQAQDLLRLLVGLAENADTRLLQDLQLGEPGHFRRDVGVLNRTQRGREVLLGRGQNRLLGLKDVRLEVSNASSGTADLGDRRLDDLHRIGSTRSAGEVEVAQVESGDRAAA